MTDRALQQTLNCVQERNLVHGRKDLMPGRGISAAEQQKLCWLEVRKSF